MHAGGQLPLDVRPFATEADYEGMVDYFLGGSDAFLRGMGVDPAKLPAREQWLAAALADARLPDQQKDRFFVAWRLNDEVIGHSSISHIAFGHTAHCHLHLWRPSLRRSGLGARFLAASIDIYFERFGLQSLASEPFADNPGPRALLAKLGFRSVRRYRTTPTTMAYEQEVHRHEMTRDEWQSHRTG